MKICGWKEQCFERGECWGHLEGILCQYLSEKEDGYNNGLISFCKKFNEFVSIYDTEIQRERLMKNELNQFFEKNYNEIKEDILGLS